LGTDKLLLIPHRKFELRTLIKLIGFIHSKKIELIHSHGKGAGIYSRILKIITGRTVIHTFHGLHIDNYNSFAKLFYLSVEKLFALFTKKFICVSKSESSRVLKAGITSPSKIAIINNGVEIGDSPAYKIGPDQIKKILHVTRFDNAKNSLLLIAIIEELKKIRNLRTNLTGGGSNFRFVVVGKGDDEYEFKNRIAKENLDDYAEMAGASENIQNYLRDSFCLISTSRWEGLPLSVMEAMSCGVPVIATNVPGNNDLVEHYQTGFLFDIQKPDEAAGYLLQLMENSDLWKKFSAASIEKIRKNFTADRMARETENLYLEILNKHYK
jgi:glycosyltransferase involved in cell wall biosynthesis